MLSVPVLILFILNVILATSRENNRLIPRPRAAEKPGGSGREIGKYMLANAVGGVVTVYSGHPFDLVKVLLQTSVPGKYAGPIDCARKVWLEAGLRGLYSGATASLYSKLGVIVLMYSAYQNCQVALLDRGVSLPWATFYAGNLSGLLVSLVYGPMDLIKIRMQTQVKGSERPISGVLDCVKTIVKNEGLLAMTNGLGSSMIKTVPQLTTFYCLLEYFKSTHEMDPFLAGGIAGVLCWLIGLPLDRVKSLIQSSTGTQQRFYQVFLDLLRAEGVSGFYRGWQPVLLRAGIVNAVGFKTIESTKTYLDSLLE